MRHRAARHLGVGEGRGEQGWGRLWEEKSFSMLCVVSNVMYTQRADRFEKKGGGRRVERERMRDEKKRERGEREKMQDETKTKHNGGGGGGW